jgi:glycosyltransferase involved in cell wall biosynthesis
MRNLHIAIVNPILATPNIRPSMVFERIQPIRTEDLSGVNIIDLAVELASLGHTVTVYAARAFLENEEIKIGKRLTIMGVETKLQQLFHPALIPFTPSLANSHSLKDADVIQSAEFHQFSTFFAAHLASRARVPFLVWQELFHYMRSPGNLYQKSFELTIGRSVCSATSQFILRTRKAKAFLLQMGVSPLAIGPWVPTGIDGNLFRPQPKSLFSEDFGFSKDDTVVLTAGRLSSEKGVDMAIRAISLLRKREKKASLLVAGSGHEMGNLVALAESLGVASHVKFLGRQSKHEMVRLYNSSDIFLLPSRKDLFPFSVLEAGGCGIPCVSARVGSVDDFVNNGVNGVLVEPSSVDAIAEGINTLMVDEDLRKAMGKEARRVFLESFDISVVAKRLEETYSQFTLT